MYLRRLLNVVSDSPMVIMIFSLFVLGEYNINNVNIVVFLRDDTVDSPCSCTIGNAVGALPAVTFKGTGKEIEGRDRIEPEVGQ